MGELPLVLHNGLQVGKLVSYLASKRRNIIPVLLLPNISPYLHTPHPTSTPLTPSNVCNTYHRKFCAAQKPVYYIVLNTASTSILMVVKMKVKYSICLAIEDGANDVGMIQVGVVMCITFGVHLCINYVIVTLYACLLPRLPTWG